MKRRLMAVIACVLIACTAAYSQTARQILDKTAATLATASGARANFHVSGKLGNTSGTIAVKGKKFNASTPQSVVWFDGKTQWTYMKRSQEVNISTPTEAQQQAINPYRFIYMYKNGYKLFSKSVAGGWEVRLVAQGLGKAIKEMYITVGKNYQLKQVRMKQTGGWTTINVSNFRKANIADSQFRFNQREYPGAEVIDLR